LHRYPNYREEWDYAFSHDMQKGGVNNVIADICTFLRHKIFHVDGAFFDKAGTLAEFPQLCNYERFALQIVDVLWSFRLYEMCTYNEFEYYKVFSYYLNVYMWIWILYEFEIESCMNLKYSNIDVICIFQMVSAGLG
jgi:hypothetical protein